MDHFALGMQDAVQPAAPAAEPQGQQAAAAGWVGVIPHGLMDDFQKELQDFSSTLSDRSKKPHSLQPQPQSYGGIVIADTQQYHLQEPQISMGHSQQQPQWDQQQQQQQQLPLPTMAQLQNAFGVGDISHALAGEPADMSSPFLTGAHAVTSQQQPTTPEGPGLTGTTVQTLPGLPPLPDANVNFDTLLSLFEMDVDMVGGVVAPEEWQTTQAKPDLERLDSALQMLQSVTSLLPEDSSEGISVSRGGSSTELDRSSEANAAAPLDANNNLYESDRMSLDTPEESEPSVSSTSGSNPPVPHQPMDLTFGQAQATDAATAMNGERWPSLSSHFASYRTSLVARCKDGVDSGMTTVPQLTVDSHMREMAAMLSSPGNQIDAATGVTDLEKKLGRRISQTNEISEFCDLLSKTCMESVEGPSGPGVTGSVSDLLALKSGLDMKSRDGLGVRASMAGQKGKGRVRPKDHLAVMERYLTNLKAQEAGLSVEVEHLTSLNTKMDLMLNMKIGVMDEIKVNNVALDSYLQELVISRALSSLEGMEIEERGKMTSMQSIFLRDKPEYVNQTITATMNAYRTTVHNVTKVVEQMTSSPEAQTEENTRLLEMYRDKMCAIIDNLLAVSGSNMFFYFIKQLDDQVRDLGVDFVMQKYAAVNQLLKPEKSQLRKLFALNAIFTSRVKALVDEKAKLMQELSDAQMASASVSMYDQCRNLQLVETLICKLRLNGISMLEARMLFNMSFIKKIMTAWQTSVLIVHTYPILPDPQSMTCELLGVENMIDVPLERYKDYFDAPVCDM